jgi:hypothetical protein
MGLIISYCIGAGCVLYPRVMASAIAEVLGFVTKHKYGAAAPEKKKVRPIFSIIVGVTIIALTAGVHSDQ